MTGKSSVVIAATMAAILAVPVLGGGVGVAGMGAVQYVHAQAYLYDDLQQKYPGADTISDAVKLARERVKTAQENPGSGSGTPIMSIDGALGASVISGAVFGGIAAAFFVKGRSGRYAAPGTG